MVLKESGGGTGGQRNVRHLTYQEHQEKALHKGRRKKKGKGDSHVSKKQKEEGLFNKNSRSPFPPRGPSRRKPREKYTHYQCNEGEMRRKVMEVHPGSTNLNAIKNK